MRLPEKFESEQEEAQWWYDNRNQLEQEAIEVMRDGRAVKLTGLTLRERIEAMKAKFVNHPVR